MKDTLTVGIGEGDICNRNECVGVIETHSVSGCSCHITPPCSACTSPRNYCKLCGWEECEDDVAAPVYQPSAIIDYSPKPLDTSKIDYYIKSHTHFSQICEGVYPAGATREEVWKKVRGSFGGRFEYFGGGRFKFVAYTD